MGVDGSGWERMGVMGMDGNYGEEDGVVEKKSGERGAVCWKLCTFVADKGRCADGCEAVLAFEKQWGG